MQKGYFGLETDETHWAVICKGKGCKKTIAFAMIGATDGKFYRRIVAIECPECKARFKYRPVETIRLTTLISAGQLPAARVVMTSPLFEE